MPKGNLDKDIGISEFTFDNVIAMIDLVNKKHADVQKGGKIISHVEAECQKEIKHSHDAIERVFLLTDAEEEMGKILLETPHKKLERYAEKIVQEEKITANQKLYATLEKEINHFKNIYITKFERDLGIVQELIDETSKDMPKEEKDKIKYIVDIILNQETKASEIIKMFKIPDQFEEKITDMMRSIQRFKTELSNFQYNIKQKILKIIPGAMTLDRDNPEQKREKERGMQLMTIWNKMVDDLCLYYENEIRNT